MGIGTAIAIGLLSFGQLPPLTHQGTLTQGLNDPARVAVTASEILVTVPRANAVVRFDLAGASLGSFGESAGPLGVAVHPDGRIFVSRRDDAKVAVYDSSGTFQHFLGGGAITFDQPTDLAVDPVSGRLYVVDSGADRFYGFDSGEALALIVGIRGSGAGQFKTPSAIAVDTANNRLVVADQENYRVQVFTPAGLFVRKFGYRIKYLPSGSGEGWMPRSAGLAVDAGGRIYVTDAVMGTLRIFNSAGAELGKVVGYGTAPGQLQTPGGVAIDGTGRVIVVSSTADSVEIYNAPAFTRATGDSGRHFRGGNACSYDLLRAAGGGDDRWALNDALGGGLRSALEIPGWDPPHMLDDLSCGRCHNIDGQPEGHIGTTDGQTVLCVSCHFGAGQAFGALFRPAANLGISHAWDVPAVNATYGSAGPTPGGPMDEYLDGGNIKCATCHNQHNNDAGAPFLRVPAEVICQDCHTEHVSHTPSGPWQPTCRDCHAAHDADDNNLSLIGSPVRNQTLGMDKPVVLTARTGPNSFADGDPGEIDGLCEVCHTATTYHKHDGSGVPHNGGQDCIMCHPHEAGFLPVGGDCTGCHAAAQDNGDGIPAGGRRAVVGEFPAGDAHAHYGAELDGAACVVCHDQATHMDGYVDLIDPDDASIYTFLHPGSLTSDPDVSDFCAGCHDADGAARLPAPADPFGNGNAPSEVASKFQGTLQWIERYGDFCFGTFGTLRQVNSHHDISDADQSFSGAKIECLSCHGAHASSASQPMADPFAATTPWSGTGDDFCLACHSGGAGSWNPGFPAGVVGPVIDTSDPEWVSLGVDWCETADGMCESGGCSSLSGIASNEYVEAPWYVDYTDTHAAHGGASKRGWAGYSGAPAYDLDCTACHDPHGSYTPTNPAGNPYLIRDFVDGTALVDDGPRVMGFNGPPWTTFGTARAVTVGITPGDPDTVDWGGADGLCSVCHTDWLNAMWAHDFCIGCQSCHAHGATWGEYDWVGGDDDVPVPINDACYRAFTLTIGTPVAGDTTAAVDDGTPTCGIESPAQGLWYVIRGTGNTLTATTCRAGTAMDTAMQVFCDCETLGCIGGNDNDAGCGISATASTVSWCSDADQYYYIHVGGAGAASGVFELLVTNDAVACGSPPACTPEIGACCVAGVLAANNTKAECDALGGTWFIGEDCDTFSCPAPLTATGSRAEPSDIRDVAEPAIGTTSDAEQPPLHRIDAVR